LRYPQLTRKLGFMSIESPPANDNPSFRLRLSGPLFLFIGLMNLIDVFKEFKSASVVGAIIHLLIALVCAAFGVFFVWRFWIKK
jgi:uncharacterized membrane-anchored protein